MNRADMATRTVTREWVRDAFYVTSVHPQAGPLYRGRISLAHSGHDPQARQTWRVLDVDHFELPDVVGDYLNAEAALFAATSGLDEPVTDLDLIEV